MSAITKPLPNSHIQPGDNGVNEAFLRFLPAVETHAKIQFRHLPRFEREERIAEAAAAAFVNVHDMIRKGNGHRLKPSTVAHFACLGVKDGRHVGGGADSKCDVMSRKAQRRFGFKVVGLPWNSEHAFNCMTDPTSSVWKEVLADDKRTPVPDQAAFRIDWSLFLGQQHDRTRKCVSLLAEGHKRCEVADRMGTTPSAVTQRMARVEREWDRFQGVAPDGRNGDQER